MKRIISSFIAFTLVFSRLMIFSANPAYALTEDSNVASFVSRCYLYILGRPADDAGLQNWTNLLLSNTSTAAEIINGFMESTEYKNKNNSSDQTVNILYNTMLDRPADEAGKQNWVSVLDSTGSNASVINGFCGSQEFLTLCNDYGITAGSVQAAQPAPAPTTTKTGLEGFVERCYIQALNRNSDAAGLANWCAILKTKQQSPKQVASGFVFSQEMKSRNLSNEETVDVFYRLYLGREADPAGRSSWLTAMNHGMALEELNNGFADSQEFRNIVESYGLSAEPDHLTDSSPDKPSDNNVDTVETTSVTLKVTGTATCNNTNHVGYNWEETFLLNGESFIGTGMITVENGDIITIGCTIRENDKYPDIGSFSENISITPEIITKGITINKTVPVTEHNGKYSGYTANWDVIITISPD